MLWSRCLKRAMARSTIRACSSEHTGMATEPAGTRLTRLYPIRRPLSLVCTQRAHSVNRCWVSLSMDTSKGLPRFGHALSGHLPPGTYHRLTSWQRRLKRLMGCGSMLPGQSQYSPHIRPVEITIALNELGFRSLQGLLDFIHGQGVDLMGPLPAGKLNGYLI